MISISQSDSTELNSILKSNSSIETAVKCIFEYDINSMVTFSNTSVTNNLTEYVNASGALPFKKLFPIDSIVKPNRPAGAGIKYYINGDIYTGQVADPKTVNFPLNYRTYLPGATTYYKYWISKKGYGANISIKYSTAPKKYLTNKITVNFEISHAKPTEWSIYASSNNNTFSLLKSGTNANISDFVSGSYDAGTLNLYYTGSSWSFSESDLNTSSTFEFTDLKIVTNGVTDKYIAIISVAPKLVKDVSSDIVSFDIEKDASVTDNSLLPVGLVSANTLMLNMNKYNETTSKFAEFLKSETEMASDIVYFYKNTKVKPYIKIKKSNGEYVEIKQGTFYMQSWSINDYGDVNVSALDGAKILQEIKCPEIVCENFSLVAIIRRLLDSIGFTNYKFNVKSDITKENGIITPQFWWTDVTQTVWETIQELCRDVQLTSLFDENDVLQFYTRDYFYNSSNESSWVFTSEQYQSYLPNITSLSKKELPTGNQIKILWSPVVKSNYLGDSNPLWKAETSFLAALALTKDIAENITPDADGKQYINLSPVITSKYSNYNSVFGYSGFLLVDSEVIEFDAVEYKYKTLFAETINNVSYNAGDWVIVNLESSADNMKYLGRSVPGLDNFVPTGRYRVKTRGAMSTTKSAHYANGSSAINSWTQKTVEWK